MKKSVSPVLTGVLVDEHGGLTLAELCRVCGVHAEYVLVLVDEGALDPNGNEPADWRFSGACLHRVNKALRLQQDLQINTECIALVLDLLDEIKHLRLQLTSDEASSDYP